VSPQFVIAGFPSTDFTPGAYGKVTYGGGATSAASIPLKLLVVGMKASNTSGTSVQDSEVDQVFTVSQADTLYGMGGQITRACQAALQTQGVSVYGAPCAVPASPTQASIQFSIVAAQTIAGTLTVRLGGLSVQCGVGSSDTATTIATNLAAAINSVLRMPFTATSSAGIVTATCITPGADGNAYLGAVDVTQCAGVTCSMTGTVRANTTAYLLNALVSPATANGYYYQVTTAGTTGATVPTFPTTIGTTVSDGSAVLTCVGKVLTGGIVTAFGGAGVESVANVLAVIQNQQFDRIALCQNDATNLGLWHTQVDAQAGPLSIILQHVVCATNGTLATATSLAQTTLNDQRFQVMWYLNGETHYSEMAATFAAIRTSYEQTDPDHAYDNMVLPGVAPQSQRPDWPIHATLVSALNNGVTPIGTTPSSQAYVVRSITSHSLNGTTPDYSCLDTSESVVADYCLVSLLLYWTNVFLPSNPRCGPDLPANQPAYPSGVGYPTLWSKVATAVLIDFENGSVGGATIPPILYNVEANPVVSSWDPVAQRIMSAVTVHPMPNQHQIGVSVSQSP
jgi:phage tail sheath gpL-like